jgi:hypothetical protein
MQRLKRSSVVLSLLAIFAMWSAPRLAAQASTVRCESKGQAPVQCPIPPNAKVELARTLSQEACRQRHNWDVAANFVWVSGGCRADFTVTSVGYGPGTGNASANPNQLRACRSEADRRMPAYSYDQISVEPESREGSVAYVRWRAGTATGLCAVHPNGRVLQFTTDAGGGWNGAGTTTRIVCESRRTDREECRIPSGARIRLLRQTSQNPCRLNDTYGQGADYIWVAEGCRGEFEVVTAGGGGGPGASRVVCASAVNTRRKCAIPPGAQARLVRQMSEVPCRTGQNWGVGADYVWVARGCSGEFGVTGGGGWQGGNGGGGGTGLPDRVLCESKGGERTECRIKVGGQVRLARQISTTQCTQNHTWGYGYGMIWVTKGCRGEFEVR